MERSDEKSQKYRGIRDFVIVLLYIRTPSEVNAWPDGTPLTKSMLLSLALQSANIFALRSLNRNIVNLKVQSSQATLPRVAVPLHKEGQFLLFPAEVIRRRRRNGTVEKHNLSTFVLREKARTVCRAGRYISLL